jgi:hypothetical protein
MLVRVGAEHHAVDNEGVLVPEERREADHAVTAFKGIVFGDYAARRKGAAQGGDALDVAPEIDLFSEENVASLAVFGALVGEVRLVLCGEFCSGDEDGVIGHSVLLDEDALCKRSF